MKPVYYKALWHNCNMCRIHYMSEEPHIRAHLCDECWNSIPHFKVNEPIAKRPAQRSRSDWSLSDILLYTVGNLMCLAVIGYYLWFK
jgi:hypothetical protein